MYYAYSRFDWVNILQTRFPTTFLMPSTLILLCFVFRNKDFCPIDNFKLNKEADLFPDNYTKREILQQRVVCPFAMNGCPVQLGPLELDGHITQCEHRNTASRSSLRENKIPCSFKDLGCDCILKNEEYLARHMESSVQNHLRVSQI